jgi:hypothetical protein
MTDKRIKEQQPFPPRQPDAELGQRNQLCVLSNRDAYLFLYFSSNGL